MRKQRLGTPNPFTVIPSHLGEDMSITLDSKPFLDLGGDTFEGSSRDHCPSLEPHQAPGPVWRERVGMSSEGLTVGIHSGGGLCFILV